MAKRENLSSEQYWNVMLLDFRGCSIRGGVTSQSAIKLGFKLGPSIYLSFLSNLPL